MTLRVLSAALALAAVGGCATVSGGGVRDDAPVSLEPRTVLPNAVGRLLEQEPTGSRFRISHSHWGTDVVIALQADQYAAASGRTCRRIVIDPDGMPRLGLACRLGDGTWVESRVLHDGGRPLTESAS